MFRAFVAATNPRCVRSTCEYRRRQPSVGLSAGPVTGSGVFHWPSGEKAALLPATILVLILGTPPAAAVTFETVAVTGGTAPGTGGATLSILLSSPSLNDAGETAFGARLTGTGVTAASDSGSFLSDGLGSLEPVVREGDVLDIGGGGQGIFIADTRGIAAAVPVPAARGLLIGRIAALGVAGLRQRRAGA